MGLPSEPLSYRGLQKAFYARMADPVEGTDPPSGVRRGLQIFAEFVVVNPR